MLKVAITGNISAGKSVAEKILRDKGFYVFDTDIIAHDILEKSDSFPKDGPILIITDGYIESDLIVKRDHAFLIPVGHRLPFRPAGKVFYYDI